MSKHLVGIILTAAILVLMIINYRVVSKHDAITTVDHRVQIDNTKAIQSDITEMKEDIKIIKTHLTK